MTQKGQVSGSDAPLIVYGEVVEGQSWTLVWRPEDQISAPLLTANATALDVTVYEADGSAALWAAHYDAGTTPALSTVVLGALATDNRWQGDGIGYTVLVSVDTSGGWTVGGSRYRAEVVLTPVASATLKGAKVMIAYVTVRPATGAVV